MILSQALPNRRPERDSGITPLVPVVCWRLVFLRPFNQRVAAGREAEMRLTPCRSQVAPLHLLYGPPRPFARPQNGKSVKNAIYQKHIR